jgi:hypothetical protein
MSEADIFKHVHTACADRHQMINRRTQAILAGQVLVDSATAQMTPPTVSIANLLQAEPEANSGTASLCVLATISVDLTFEPARFAPRNRRFLVLRSQKHAAGVARAEMHTRRIRKSA